MAQTNITRDSTIAEQILPVGTALLDDQFTVEEHLGAGGFGVTYRAKDNVLGRTIVIKECFPEEFCFRDGNNVVARHEKFADPLKSIVRMFMREAQSLAKLRHPNIVGVHRAFEENQTAYMVLDLIEGQDLFDLFITTETPLSPARTKSILMQLLDAIEKIHDADMLHRDISPDNILIEESGTPVLIDFGAARADASRHTRAVSSLLVVKDGYSPQEFYVAGSDQAPNSDLYALAATFYHLLSGEAPVNSQARIIEMAGRKPDPCLPLAGRIEGYDQEFLQAIDAAMEVHPSDRLQSAGKWRSLISQCAPENSAALSTMPRASTQDISLEFERSLTRLVEETNDEVKRISQIPDEPEEIVDIAEKPKKPVWVEEFNRESLVPSEIQDHSVEETADFQDDTQSGLGSTRDEIISVTPRRVSANPNGVDRPPQKRDRVVSDLGKTLEKTSAQHNSNPKPNTPTAAPEPEELSTNGSAAIETRNRRNFTPIGITALLICFYFLFFFPVS